MQDCDRFVEKTIDSSSLPVGAAVFYLVACTQGGSEMGLGEDGSGLSRFNDHPCPACDRPFETVFRGDSEGDVTTQQYRVIDNRTDWCAFWPAYCNTPDLDFATHVAIVAAEGTSRDSCAGAEITCIRNEPASPDIRSTVVRLTGAGCDCLQAFTYPVHVVRVARPVGTGSFTMDSEELCP
jgi:hypothetical protein